MKKQPWKTYAFWILLTVLTGALAGLLTRDATQIYNETIVKPPLSPPAVLFPVVWSILYVLMGVSAARVSLTPRTDDRFNGLRVYLVQLAFNFLWSILFFTFQAFGFAFVWLLVLWGLILAMILLFRRTDKAASLLQIPYLLWVTFAGYLNLGVWLLNRSF